MVIYKIVTTNMITIGKRFTIPHNQGTHLTLFCGDEEAIASHLVKNMAKIYRNYKHRTRDDFG